MDEAFILPFTQTISSVLGQFGVQVIEYGAIREEDAVLDGNELVVIIGITGALRGNLAYSFPRQSAEGLASAMMMGFPVETLDDMSLSALAELCNMFTGSAISRLSDPQRPLDITPPSVIMGESLYVVLGSERALSQRVVTGLGPVDLTLVLEI